MSDKPGTAWAYFPSTNATGGDAWFNNSSGQYDNPRKGNYAALTFIHEIGHALGLEHAHEAYVMPVERDSMEYTVMSYRSYVGASTTSGYTNETWGYAQSLMMYDIAAVQHMYGANYATNSGNTTYAWSPGTGEMSVNGVGQGAAGGNRIFMTLWDGGGTDTYDFSSYASALKVDLRPGNWTTTSSSQLARLYYDGSKPAVGNIANALLHRNDGRSLIENATGGSGNDRMTGNQAANHLKGGAGSDSLTGAAGNDVLDGGLGSDTAIFSGQRAQYSVLKQSNGSLQVLDLRTGTPDGTDVVWGAEWLQFTDRIYSASEVMTGSLPPPTTSTTSVLVASGEQPATLTGGDRNERIYGNVGNDALYGGGGNDFLHGAAGADRLDGGAGMDFASYSGADAAVLVDRLSPSLNRGDARGDIHVGIEGIIGSDHADSLRGNGAADTMRGIEGNDTLFGRGGNDVLDGGPGDDKLYGQAGKDTLVGGSGRDVFAFRSPGDSRGFAIDVIKDFVRGTDRLDLAAIDANSKFSGNQAFIYIGTAAFSGKHGELRFASGVLSADINGDGNADFQVKVAGLSALARTDFYL
jgi:serralysin